MALPSSGRIKLSDVNTELGLSSTTRITLGQATVRTLTGVSSGRIRLAADGYGKSNRAVLSYIFSSNTTQTTINPAAVAGYIAGKTDLTITVNSGVYVYSTNTSVAGLTISGFSAGDTIALVNNGYIIGRGGNGATGTSNNSQNSGLSGGPALSISYNVTITNNSYIAGGGGGGGCYVVGGGGGAGGGNGGNSFTQPAGQGIGGAGGGPGEVGQNSIPPYSSPRASPGGGAGGAGSVNMTFNGNNGFGGGGGGRILPGVGGVAYSGYSDWRAGNGGSGNSPGSSPPYSSNFWFAGAGGGGWGAAGGNAFGAASGGAGGKAIALNGYSVTYAVTGTIYGAVS
jgi:hypothetical protein